MSEEEFKPPTDPSLGYDPGEVKTWLVAIFFVAGAALLIVVMVGVSLFYSYFHEQIVYEEVLKPVSQDLKELHAREDSALYAYKYADRTKGEVRLPISRAMDLIVEESANGKWKFPTKPSPWRPETPAGGAGPAVAAPGSGAAAPASASKK